MILLSDDEKKLRLNGVKGSNGNGDGIKVNRDGGSNRNGNGRPRLTLKWIELLIDPDPGKLLIDPDPGIGLERPGSMPAIHDINCDCIVCSKLLLNRRSSHLHSHLPSDF